MFESLRLQNMINELTRAIFHERVLDMNKAKFLLKLRNRLVKRWLEGKILDSTQSFPFILAEKSLRNEPIIIHSPKTADLDTRTI